MTTSDPYEIVELQSGAITVRSLVEGETFHPVIGPTAEAEALYVRQLRLPERVKASAEEFVIWDIGLGAGANALTTIKSISGQLSEAKRLRLISFDLTTAALSFALAHARELNYLAGFEEAIQAFLGKGNHSFACGQLQVHWQMALGDFPTLLKCGNQQFIKPGQVDELKSGQEIGTGQAEKIPAPHAILFDPHSPQKNPGMWTLPLFANLFESLDPQRPCALANYTRSTLARTAMLLGGFFVGVGHATGFKEETTVAANSLALLDEPLNQRWLERAIRSHSAEPLLEPKYHCSPLTPETIKKLTAHPQFQGLS